MLSDYVKAICTSVIFVMKSGGGGGGILFSIRYTEKHPKYRILHLYLKFLELTLYILKAEITYYFSCQ